VDSRWDGDRHFLERCNADQNRAGTGVASAAFYTLIPPGHWTLDSFPISRLSVWQTGRLLTATWGSDASDLRQVASPPVPTGSLVKTNSKFGHELIAGPVVGNQQVVGQKEPGAGTHVEPIDNAARRNNSLKS